MVQQMATMITEQGTIVDRIDYNLEVWIARLNAPKPNHRNSSETQIITNRKQYIALDYVEKNDVLFEIYIS